MLKQRFFEYYTYITTIAFFFGLLFSESVLSISSGLFLLLLFFSGNTKEKLQFIAKEKTVWLLAGIYGIYLVGMLFCNNLQVGMWELKRYLFWATLPISIALIPKVTENKIWYLLLAFVFMVTGASIHTSIKIIFSDYFQVTNVREAAHISHVALSIQVVFAIYILLISRILKTPVLGRLNKWFVFALCAWFVFFLGFQKSLNAWLALYGSGIVFFFWVTKRVKYQKLIRFVFLMFAVTPFIYVGSIAYKYFDIKEMEPNYELKTELGNPYDFRLDRFETENGQYVYWYVSSGELERAWNSVSSIKMNEKDATGYDIYDTILRYMTSKGLKKDSVGVLALSDYDIKNIQAGVANVIFVEKKYSLYPRIYQTVWELDQYYRTGNPNNQSLSQRIEFLKAARYIIHRNFWGVGTGNYKQAFDEAFVEINSQLDPELRNNVHNQYLNYIVKFGFIGFFAIMCCLIFAIIWKKQYRNVLSVLLITIVAITSMGETTLETHVGLHFFLFFLSIFMWHSPTVLSNSFSNKENLN